MAFWVQGLGFRFRVQGLGFRAHSIVGVLDQNLCWPGWHGVYQDRACEHEQGIRPSHCKTADMEVTTTLTMVPAKKQIMTMQTMVPMVLLLLFSVRLSFSVAAAAVAAVVAGGSES